VTDPITAGAIIKLAQSVAETMNTGLAIYLERARTETRDQERRESIAASAAESEKDRQLARDLYLQLRTDKREDDQWNARAARDNELFKSELEHYPLESRPGQLRQSLHLADDPSQMPPLVLLMPASRDSDEAWRQLSRRMSNSLMYLQNANLAIVMQADRAFTWPHYALVEYDLRDVPTIVISVEVVTGWISILVGGCNLGGDRVVRKTRQVAWLPLPDTAYWTPTRLAALENTSVGGFRRPASPEDAAGLETLRMEWATRLAVVAVVAAMDSYYLLRRRGYDERLDEAAAMLMPDLTGGLELAVDPAGLADPAYHFLHQARRQLTSGDPGAAGLSVAAALRDLSGEAGLSPAQALRTAISAGRLESWHRAFLNLLTDNYPAAGLLDKSAVEILNRPAPSADTGQAVAEVTQKREYVGREIPITRDTSPDARLADW
jgi:hypothetical protein